MFALQSNFIYQQFNSVVCAWAFFIIDLRRRIRFSIQNTSVTGYDLYSTFTCHDRENKIRMLMLNGTACSSKRHLGAFKIRYDIAYMLHADQT